MMAQWYGYTILGSMTLDVEIGKIESKDTEKYADVSDFYRQTVTERATAKKHVFDHYAPLAVKAGVRGPDVFHLCFAISARADYLVTTDKKFIKATERMVLPVTVINPTNFPLGGEI